jgi:glycosyltransferase involved in cell wall biosynthesis
VGWNWVQQISQEHEVWLLTMDECRKDIERELPKTVHATFLPSYRMWERLQNMPIPGLEWIYYYWWQWKAYRKAVQLHAEAHFDLAHHITFASWRAPSFISLLPIPLVWGPVGGGGSIPRTLRGEIGRKGRIFEIVRDFCQKFSRWDPFVRLTMARAAVILAGNQETADLLPSTHQAKLQIMSLGGMSASENSALELPATQLNGFVILVAGLLVPRKAGSLALKAFHRLTKQGVESTLVFAGKGPEGDRLAALANELGISEHVRFLGGMTRNQVLGWMTVSDVLLFPSLRESSPLVLLEAMMAETPIVCLDQGGPGEMVTPECGIKVRVRNSNQVVQDLAAALFRLVSDPALCRSMGEAGRRRVLSIYDWSKRKERMLQIYEEVTRHQSTAQQMARAGTD